MLLPTKLLQKSEVVISIVSNTVNMKLLSTFEITAATAASNQQPPISSVQSAASSGCSHCMQLAAAPSSHCFLSLFLCSLFFFLLLFFHSTLELLTPVTPTFLSDCSWNPQKIFRSYCESHPLEAGEMDKLDFESKTCCLRARTKSRRAAFKKKKSEMFFFSLLQR